MVELQWQQYKINKWQGKIGIEKTSLIITINTKSYKVKHFKNVRQTDSINVS